MSTRMATRIGGERARGVRGAMCLLCPVCLESVSIVAWAD
jgi:hypothetical protein